MERKAVSNKPVPRAVEGKIPLDSSWYRNRIYNIPFLQMKPAVKARVEEEEGGVARTGGELKGKMKARVEEDEGGVADQETTEASGSGRDGTTYHRGRLMTKEEKYAIQCNSCYKWRIIPSKKTYEVIGSRILEQPFVCANARKWKRDIRCDAPTDLDESDKTLVWAIDKHNIPVPPEGFHRVVSLRPKGSKQFADTYYKTPCGKKLNSTNQAQKYLDEHPDVDAKICQFSFTIPKLKPVRKAEAIGTGESSKRDMKDGTQSGPEPRKRMKGTEPNSEPMRVKTPGPGQPPRPRPLPATGTPAKSGKLSASKSSASPKD